MNTNTQTRPAIDHALLRSFTDPNREAFKDLVHTWNLRTDGTQSDSNRMRIALGEEAFQHYNHDTIATNGRIMLFLPRYKHPQSVRSSYNIPAEWFWCFEQIELQESISEATPEAIAKVPENLREQIAKLPGVVWISIGRVSYYEHGEGAPTRKFRPPPAGILFFRFTGGLGVAVALNED